MRLLEVEGNQSYGQFADSARVIADVLDGLLPPDPVTVEEWARRHRYFNNTGGGYVGRYSPDVAPYLVEPQENFTSKSHDCMAVVGPGQSGKTTIPENGLLHAVPNHPSKWLWYMQTDAAVEAYVKDRIDPMIESHPCLNEHLGLRPVDDSLHFKRFKRMRMEFLAANKNNLINKSAPIIIADEIDAYPESLGDPKELLDVRRQTFGMNSMLFIPSHPDRATDRAEKGWTAGVMLVYADSTQGRWYWPCPDCNGFSSPTPGAEHYMRVGWSDSSDLDEVAESAHMICPHCGSCDIHDQHRWEMNQSGLWVHKGQHITKVGKRVGTMIDSKTLGYWITGTMSPFVRGGLGGLVRARVKAQRKEQITGDTTSLKEVMVKQWGWPWSVKAAGQEKRIEVEELLDRVEPYPLKQVPAGARYIVAWVDVQDKSFEPKIVAFGPGMECWVIDRFSIFKSADETRAVEPAVKLEDWDLLVKQVMEKTYPLSDGSGREMPVLRMGVDSGGSAGVTTRSYEFFRRMKRKGKSSRLILTKGASTANAARVRKTFPDSQRKDRKAEARGDIPVRLFNANLLKDEIDAALRNITPGPGYMHLSEFLKAEDDDGPHLYFEELTSETRSPDGKWVKQKARNEALDQAVGTRVMALTMKADRINWDNPAAVPGWAKPWDENSVVFAKGDTSPVAAVPVARKRRVRSKGI